MASRSREKYSATEDFHILRYVYAQLDTAGGDESSLHLSGNSFWKDASVYMKEHHNMERSPQSLRSRFLHRELEHYFLDRKLPLTAQSSPPCPLTSSELQEKEELVALASTSLGWDQETTQNPPSTDFDVSSNDFLASPSPDICEKPGEEDEMNLIQTIHDIVNHASELAYSFQSLTEFHEFMKKIDNFFDSPFR
ncbi:hypothetical protein P9112_012121 [Eukaryota sp. TZLM1-RC]